jgi:dihydrolipoamide dehydrogenase
MYDLLILGGGPAGVSAALRARELGATVALVERNTLGGACTNDGCVPTRFLAHAARLVRNAAEYEAYGLSGPEPKADLARVMECARAMVERIHSKKAIRGHLAEAGVDVVEHAGQASFVDAHTVECAGGREFKAKNILICAGGHAKRLPILGGDLALTHSDIWTMAKLPSKLLVVGAAATGCQLASIFTAFGSHVTLVDTTDRIIPAEDADLSAEVTRMFRGHGIEVLTETVVSEIQELSGRRRRVLMSTSGDPIERDFDAVIAAVGWVGNIDRLNLDSAGVRTERGYIVVDETLRTSTAHIYAAGDITGRMMLVQCADDEGQAAAENALTKTGRTSGHSIVPHGSFTDPEYGSVGLTEDQARERGDIAVATVPYHAIDRAVIDGRPEGFCKLIVDRGTRHIVGAHVVGQQAVEIVQVAAAAMQAGSGVDHLANLEYAYPTFTSVIGLAARQILRNLAN